MALHKTTILKWFSLKGSLPFISRDDFDNDDDQDIGEIMIEQKKERDREQRRRELLQKDEQGITDIKGR